VVLSPARAASEARRMPCHQLPDRHRRTVLVAAAAAAVMLLVGPVGTARNSVHLRRSVLAAAVAPAKEERPRERPEAFMAASEAAALARMPRPILARAAVAAPTTAHRQRAAPEAPGSQSSRCHREKTQCRSTHFLVWPGSVSAFGVTGRAFLGEVRFRAQPERPVAKPAGSVPSGQVAAWLRLR
jgi:hypothetical protein